VALRTQRAEKLHPELIDSNYAMKLQREQLDIMMCRTGLVQSTIMQCVCESVCVCVCACPEVDLSLL